MTIFPAPWWSCYNDAKLFLIKAIMVAQEKGAKDSVGLPRIYSLTDDDFYTKNLSKENMKDLAPGNSVLDKFLARCWGAPENSPRGEIKVLQKTFAFLLDSTKGESEAEVDKRRMFLCFNLLYLRPDLITQLDDIPFILNHTSSRNRVWLKTCIVQALRNRAKAEAKEKRIELDIQIKLLQKTLPEVDELIKDLQGKYRRGVKSPSLERQLENVLAKLNTEIEQLKLLHKQFGIGAETELVLSLTQLHTNLEIYLTSLNDTKDTYKGIEAPNESFIQQVKKKLSAYKKNGVHDSVLDAAYIASELANVGIVLQEVVGGFFGKYWIDLGIQVTRYSNPIIYAFKTIQRSIKLLGRRFGLEFEEDALGIHPAQDRWDLASAGIFFGVTVLLSLATAQGMPVFETVAWLLAPFGLSSVWWSEYGYQNTRASERLGTMKDSDGLFDPEAQAESARVARHKKIASWALGAVIFFITLGMLAGSLAGFPFMQQVPWLLTTVTAIAGIALTSLAVIRGANFFIERKGKEMINTLKAFWAHPGASLGRGFKALGKGMVEGIIGIPGQLVDFYEKIKDYWNGLSGWQQTALVFSSTSLALSISVLIGGLAPLIGFSAAGACSLVSLGLKTYQVYQDKHPSEASSQSGVEIIKPFESEEQCMAGLSSLQSCKSAEVNLEGRAKPIEDAGIVYGAVIQPVPLGVTTKVDAGEAPRPLS